MITLVADHLLEAAAIASHRFDLFGRFNQRLAAGRRVALVGILHRHRDDRTGLEIDGVLGLVGQVRPPILHLGDLRVGILWMGPIVVRPFPLPLSVNTGQIRPGRCLDAGGSRELRQEVLIALPGAAPYDAAQRGVRLKCCRINADGFPLDQAYIGQSLQHPSEDRLVRLQIDQTTRSRDRRMVRGSLRQHQAEEVTQRKRIGSPPDRALSVQALEVANQQQPEVASGRQPRSPLVRVESLA